jgi:hypothetical protein
MKYKCPIHFAWMVEKHHPFLHFACPMEGCKKVKAAKSGERISKHVLKKSNDK